MNFDLIVIGAGPIGSYLAQIVSKSGYKVLILEEHNKVGHPLHCSGKISIKAFEKFNMSANLIIQKMKGATFCSPNMDSFTIQRKETQAYIIDRVKLDQTLSNDAVKYGATLLTNSKFINLKINPNDVTVFFEQDKKLKKENSRIIAGCDGFFSKVARVTNLYSKKLSQLRPAIQSEVQGVHNFEPNYLELYFGRNYAPGFFAWLIPTGSDSARVGLAIKQASPLTLTEYFDKFIKKHPIISEKLKDSTIISTNIHLIPTGGTIKNTISDGVIIVGDAAGQVKSTTGGGIFYGMMCSDIAGEVISEALSKSKGLIRISLIKKYQKLWKESLGKEIHDSVKIRGFLDSLSDEDYNYLFNLLKNNHSLIKNIELIGDIDKQSKMTSPILKSLYKQFFKKPNLIYKLIKNFLFE